MISLITELLISVGMVLLPPWTTTYRSAFIESFRMSTLNGVNESWIGHPNNGAAYVTLPFASASALRIKSRSGTVIQAPREACFRVLFILSAKAMTDVEQCKLPERIIKALSDANKYPERTGVGREAKTAQEIGVLKKLVAIKVAN